MFVDLELALAKIVYIIGADQIAGANGDAPLLSRGVEARQGMASIEADVIRA